MSKINRKIVNIMTCIFEILVGILLLINPVGFTTGIIIVFGVTLTVLGIISLIKYFRADAETASQESGLAKGVIFAILGLFCTFKSEWLIATFSLMTVFYGIVMLLSGVGKAQWAVDMLRAKQKYWFVEVIGAAVTIVCAILILSNPFTSTAFLWTFIGVTMIIEAVVDVVALVLGRRENR